MSNGVTDQVTVRQAKALALLCAVTGIVIGGFAGIALGLHLGLATAQEARDIHEAGQRELSRVYQQALRDNMKTLASPMDAGK